MVFTPLCRGNQMSGLNHLQGFLANYCITNGFLMTVMYRHGYTRASEPGGGGAGGPWPPHYSQKHVLAPPLLGPTSSG